MVYLVCPVRSRGTNTGTAALRAKREAEEAGGLAGLLVGLVGFLVRLMLEAGLRVGEVVVCFGIEPQRPAI